MQIAKNKTANFLHIFSYKGFYTTDLGEKKALTVKKIIVYGSRNQLASCIQFDPVAINNL